MNTKRRDETKESEYESLHEAVLENDHFSPIRIAVPIIVIIVIISLLFAYTNVQKKGIIENAEHVTSQMAEYIASNIANEMDFGKSSIKFASSAISQSMTSEILKNPVEVVTPLIENSPFDKIEYIRADGMNVMNIGGPFDASDRVYYKEGIKGNTGVWNNFHPKTSRETLMNFYTPLYYKDKISGVLTGYIAATTQIVPLFETKLYGHDVFGLLVDENGMVICSTVKSDYVKDLSLNIFLDGFGFDADEKNGVIDIINGATMDAVSHIDPRGSGRICVALIPGTDWKVGIFVPKTSLDAIVATNTRDSLITIGIISLILFIYAAFFLSRNMKRRKEISKLNLRLEEENRIFDEENKRVFKELSEMRDIIASAHMGTWRIEQVEGEEPRMYVDDTMKMLLGVSGRERTPEETYNDWFNNITPQALPSVIASVDKMKEGKFDENTYLWLHPSKGERYVRCGGTAQKIEKGFILSGYHYDVDDVVREDLAKVVMLQDALDEKNDYYSTLGTLASIYNSLHVIDLVEDTAVEIGARDTFYHKQNAGRMIGRIMTELATDEYREKALEYTDLKTLADRMQNKKYISAQLISKSIGWFLASFITMEADGTGRPIRVVFTTQSIDEAKKQEEKLIHRSRTDELTGLLNRRAYEEDIYEQNSVPVMDSFVLMSLDVNGLKVINDTLGHAAGDELLIGASQCMKRSLGPYGRIYRTGGDEFIATLSCDEKKLKEVLADFEETMANWTGKLVDSLTISYGYISKEEEPEMSVREMGIIADKRMYEAKSAHYRKTGVDRRGTQDAYRALSELYTKILKINITDDSYQVINMDDVEKTEEKGFSEKISSWLSSFGTSGQVHPNDLQEYLRKTDLQFLRNYFAGNKVSLSFVYRRKYGDEFKLVMMEIILANDYSDTNQSLYLYVKSIDR
ncbi:MAG: sensor domain-containing diguanylate cyclase [Lachnospiraceae bacterium]|nr:sensor domain-containing diguanylate cyclase [Lachnospiraceae bacterium]